MARERLYNQYQPYDRPKLPRNQWGLIDTSTLQVGTSMYSSSSSGSSVGGTMVDIKDFRGATKTEAGARGLVPAPVAGMQDYYFLKGNGEWSYVPAAKWLTEWPKSAGLEKTGLELDGNLNVTDTITTMNLEVQGTAKFWSLIIEEVKAQGGQVMISPSMFKIDYVGEIVEYEIFSATSPLIELISARTDIYNALKANDVEKVRCRRVYMRRDDDTQRIFNRCEVGDMMRCRTWNIKPGEYRNVSNRDYWTFICNVNQDTEEAESRHENEYADEDGNIYPAIWIDIAYTLKTSKNRNIPLGSTLYLDGSSIEFPSGYEEYFGADVDELKRVSQDTWDGTREAEPEFYENSEWSDIQESIIKIRGLDDQLEELTGKAAANKLYDNERFSETAKDLLDEALNGPDPNKAADQSTPTTRGKSMNSLASMTKNGTTSSNPTDEPSGLEETQALTKARQITGIYATPEDGLIINRTKENRITLAKDTITERRFVVAEDVYDYEEGVYTKIYSKGQQLNPTVEIIHDVPVIDLNEEGSVKQFNEEDINNVVSNPDLQHPVSEKTENEVNTNTADTQSGMTRNASEFIETDYSEKQSWQFGYVYYYPSFRISKLDSLACLGHLYNTDRQNAIVLSATDCIDPELMCPAMAQYSHIDIFGKTLSKFRQTAIAANGNEFIGSFLVNYNNTYMDINEKIDLFVTDIKSGLENVGIHLDGENSLITLVGSVDLRQHSQDSYDTLNLYDNLGIKRLEITPFDIPDISDVESPLDISTFAFNSIYERKTAPNYYIEYDWYNNWQDGIWFHYTRMYKYTLKNYIVSFNTSANLGYLDAGYDLDIRNVKLKLEIPAYLCGSVTPNSRVGGQDRQRVLAFTWTLKRDGVPVSNSYQNINISNYQHTGEDSDTINLYKDVILNNYTILTGGTYTVDVSISVVTYAYTCISTYYNNYYYTINARLTGSVTGNIRRNNPDSQFVDYSGHKFTIGTNGFQLINDNSRYIYASDKMFHAEWDENYIDMSNERGLQIVNKAIDVSSNKLLDASASLVFAHPTDYDYKITLPPISKIDPVTNKDIGYGLFRQITILGWYDGTHKLTIETYGEDKIQFYIFYQQLIDEFYFNNRGPIQSVTLMSTGTNTWRVISYV